jgi:hypothetical protein
VAAVQPRLAKALIRHSGFALASTEKHRVRLADDFGVSVAEQPFAAAVPTLDGAREIERADGAVRQRVYERTKAVFSHPEAIRRIVVNPDGDAVPQGILPERTPG